MAFHNLARMYSTTTGTADAVLTTAVGGNNTFDLAGVTNGEIIRYCIKTYDTNNNRPTHSEIGYGTYTTATKTVTRSVVESSTAAGAKITLTGLSEVFILPSSRDLEGFAIVSSGGTAVTIANNAADFMDLDTEEVDPHGIVTLVADQVVFAEAGYYEATVVLKVNVNSGSAIVADGYMIIKIENSGSWDNVYEYIPTTAGSTFADRNTHAHAQMYLAAGENFDCSIENHTGHSLTGIAHMVLIKKISGPA